MKRLIPVLTSVIVLGLWTLPVRGQFPPPPVPMGTYGELPASSSIQQVGQLGPPPVFTPPPPATIPPPYPPVPPPYKVPGNEPSYLAEPTGVDHWFWTFGVGTYFMEPVFQANPAFINGHTSTTTGNAVYHQTDFSQTVNFAPQAWIAFSSDSGWGLRGRWFEFSATGNASGNVGGLGLFAPGGASLSSASTGDPISATNVLYCDVVDLEMTYFMGGDCWSLLASAGIRYVHLNQSYSLTVSDAANGSTNVYSTNNFDGVGPTMSLEGHHRIGHTHFGLYGSARGSIVFGTAHQWGNIADPVNGTAVLGGHQTTVLCIGELEGGVEWSRRYGRFGLFAQVGAVGQIWFGGGSASQALSVDTSNIAPGSNFGFIGGVVRGGINF